VSLTTYLRCVLTGVLIAATAIAPLRARSAADPLKTCMDKAMSTLAMVECQATALTAAEKILETTLSRVRRALQPEQQTQLDAAQRQWRVFRKADCAVHHTKMGGTIVSITYGGCLVERTNERIREVREFLPETH
jgi:uncharacterized protein YecT (DUF1311 family)